MRELAAVTALGLTICLAGSAHAEAVFIAGLAPYERPQDAPTITRFIQTDAWREAFFRGITPPVPASLDWVRDQGAWYTPFSRPGMAPPYDIRGLRPEGPGGAVR